MNDTLRHIKTAMGWLRRIPVADNSVDFMFMAKQELQQAQAIEEAKEAEVQRKTAAEEKLEPPEEV